MSKFVQFGQHPDADQVSAFIDHALPPHEQEEMLAHLAVCAECRETVALSSPPNDAAPAVTVKERRNRWFWGVTVLTPAAAAAALTAMLLVVHFTARPDGGKGSPGPVAKLEPPPAPPSGSNAPAHGAQSPKQTARKSHPENPHEPAANSPAAKRPQAAEAPKPAEPPAESPNVAGLAPGSPTEAPPHPPALPHEEQPQIVLKSAAPDQSAPGEKERLAGLHLPSGAAAFSAAARGPQILAIDAHNAVYLSNDDGATWTSVQVPWKSRAVKAEVVSYSPRSAKQRFAAVYGGENPSAAPVPAAPATAPAPAFPVPAQNPPAAAPGSLTGTVTDRSGAVISHASVVVTDPVSHATRTAETDASGQYRIDALAPGAYDLEARAPGFGTATVRGLQIVLSAANVANLTLDVGAATQTVTVEAASPAIDTSSPAVTENLDGGTGQSAGVPTPTQPAPLFQITTQNGDQWTSADGVTWRRR